MYKKIGPVVKILLLFMIITAIYNYTAIAVMAANKIVKVKNGTSGEIRIKEDDFVTFVPQLKNKKKKQSYFYYSPENGRNLFQFGNGKYWANKKGLATVMISGLDNQGNLNFMADYNVIIEKKRTVKDTNSGKSYNNQTGNTENSNVTTTTQAAIEKQLADVTTVTLSQSSLTAKRTKIGAYDNEVTSFKVDVNSKTELSETDNANVSVVSSNSNMKVTAYLEKNVLTIDVYNTGISILTVDINGKKFNLNVNVIDNEISSTSLVIAEGGSHQLKIRGEGEGKIEWVSANPDIAEVDAGGRIVGKTKGNTLITAKVNGKTFGCVVSVTSKMRKNVVEWARTYSLKSKYSQSRRMEEGYYDCSSLAWRAYNKFGFNIMGTNYAPTAASMGQFYDQKKQIVEGGLSDFNINKMVFEPGDLFFMEGPVNNGRYRNVYHVEIISGYTFNGFDKSGKPVIGIEFANRNQNDFRGFVGKP
ncbi:MAG: Ig-like domain-containing protein [Catonella sp.]